MQNVRWFNPAGKTEGASLRESIRKRPFLQSRLRPDYSIVARVAECSFSIITCLSFVAIP